MLEDTQHLWHVAEAFGPDVIVHLAAQAGVRYSLESPRACIESNMVGTFNVMEAARQQGDVPVTRADASLLHRLTGFAPQTDFRNGIAQFAAWFRAYYKK